MATKKNKHRGKQKTKTNYKELSNTIYLRNLHALQRYYPEIAGQVESNNIISNYQIVLTGDHQISNLYVNSKDIYYYDAADPIKDMLAQMEALNLHNARIALFLGIGLGYELVYYLQNISSHQKTSFIMVIEKDIAIFKAAMQTTDLTSVFTHESVAFLVGVEEHDLFVHFTNSLASMQRMLLARAMKPVYHPSSLILFKDYYIKALQAFRESAVQLVGKYGNSPEDSLIGLNNILTNLNEIINNPGINLLQNQFRKRPGIVVSTGPSLNKNKHLLKSLEDKALIIAPDASLKILLEMGVKPHIITTLERVIEGVNHLQGFTREQLEGVYLAANPVIMPESFQVYNGPRIIVYGNLDHFRWIEIDRGILDIKYSSGNMAFKVAEALGCDPIILMGQDLAFSREGQTHAAGTFYGENQEYLLEEEQLQIMGNDGQLITTTATWHRFLKAYELDIAEYQGQCINATEGGAYIQGTQVMTLASAIDKFTQEEYYPDRLIAQALAAFSSENSAQDLEKALHIINNTMADLEQMISFCHEGIETCNHYQEQLSFVLAHPGEITAQFLSQLPAIEAEIHSWRQRIYEVQPIFQLFLTHIIQSYYIKFEMDMVAIGDKYEDPNLARVEFLLRQSEWYAVTFDICQLCVQSLAEAQERLLS